MHTVDLFFEFGLVGEVGKSTDIGIEFGVGEAEVFLVCLAAETVYRDFVDEFGRESEEYKALLQSAYEARWQGDTEFRDVLQATNGYKLTHKIGKKDRRETVLTEDEFIEHLDILRDRHNDKSIVLTIPQIIQVKQNRR